MEEMMGETEEAHAKWQRPRRTTVAPRHHRHCQVLRPPRPHMCAQTRPATAALPHPGPPPVSHHLHPLSCRCSPIITSSPTGASPPTVPALASSLPFRDSTVVELELLCCARESVSAFPSMALRMPWRRALSALHHPVVASRVAPVSLLQVKRGFAQERPEDSSTSNWGTGEPPIDEKATERGVAPGSKRSNELQGEKNSDSEGQVPTPNLSRQKSTRDFINAKREERMNAPHDSKPVSEVDPEGAKMQEEVKRKGAPPAEMAAS